MNKKLILLCDDTRTFDVEAYKGHGIVVYNAIVMLQDELPATGQRCVPEKAVRRIGLKDTMEKRIFRTMSMLLCLICLPHGLIGGEAGVAKTPDTLPSGLVLWLKSDSGVVTNSEGRVSSWADQSGQGNDVSQNDEKLKPVILEDALNSLPVMRFRGDNKLRQHLGKGAFSPGQDRNMTMIAVVRVNRKTFFGAFITLGDWPKIFNFCQSANEGNLLGSQIGGILEGQGFKILEVNVDAARKCQTAYEDAVRTGEIEVSLDFPVPLNLRIGSALDGDIAEVLVFNKVLSDGDRLALGAYLRSKYAFDKFQYTQFRQDFPFSYLPGLRKLAVSFRPNYDFVEKALGSRGFEAVKGCRAVDFEVVPEAGGAALAKGQILLDPQKQGQTVMEIPDFPDGKYAVEYVFPNTRIRLPKLITRKQFPWENNSLGISAKVYPPFEAVVVKKNTVAIAQRKYEINGFGMFDKVVSKGRDLLASPIVLRLETSKGEEKFGNVKVDCVSAKPEKAVFQASASNPAILVSTLSSVEFDGCTKVEMTLAPGKTPGPIKRLWIDISLKDSEIPLFHYSAFGGMRRNYAGATPNGGKILWGERPGQSIPPNWTVEPGTEGKNDGVVWTASDVRPWSIQTATPFVPYIWLGGPERGLAWFAENDRDWIPQMGLPPQVLSREGERVTLRIYIINRQTTLTREHKFVFGLQASPTRPMPPDWRLKGYRGMEDAIGGAMTVLGGFLCSDKYPIGHDFTLVDKMLDMQKTGGKDMKFLEEKVKSLENAKTWNESYAPEKWLEKWKFWCARGVGHTNYFEEHWTNTTYPEVTVFKDEWFGIQNVDQSYVRSYLDFALYYANEYMSRGVSLYFDNNYPKRSFDPLVSCAYRTPTGRYQPAMTIWEQREYYRRIWNLMNEWNEKATFNPPIRYMQHMTNTLLLPLNTWTTANLDIEWSWFDYKDFTRAPFLPEVLLAETLGRQVGSPGYALHPISGFAQEEKVRTPEMIRRDWAMRRVHEIPLTWPWIDACDRFFKDFKYGTPDCRIFNYWDDKPALKVSDPKVKWLALVRDGAPHGLLLLQSYRKDGVTVEVLFPEAGALMDAETRELFACDSRKAAKIPMGPDYSTRVMLAAKSPADLPPVWPAGASFFDDFEMGYGLHWISPHVAAGTAPQGYQIISDESEQKNSVLRISQMQQLKEIIVPEKFMPGGENYEIAFRYRLRSLPTSHNSHLHGLLVFRYGQFEEGEGKEARIGRYSFSLDADTAGKGSTWAFAPLGGVFTSTQTDLTTQGKCNGQAPRRFELGMADTAWHKIVVRVNGRRHALSVDGKIFLAGESKDQVKPCFQIMPWWTLVNGKIVSGIELDDIVIRAL